MPASNTPAVNPIEQVLRAVDSAGASQRLTAGAQTNLRRWLTEPGYAKYTGRIVEFVEQGRWEELEARFWEVLPFGTGGRRGPMAEFGSATMNERTVAESAHGMAAYFKQNTGRSDGRAVIAHDTRNRSPEFARLTATTLAAHGFTVFLFDGHRSTPALSFAVRHLKCDIGVMISASHNPPADNGFKAYWSNGGQVLPPHDKGIVDAVYKAADIPTIDFDQAVANGKIEIAGEAIDAAYIAAVKSQSLSLARDLPALYTPLHGVGETSAYRTLREAGFKDVDIFELQRQPDGNFSNVPNQFPNPELPEVWGPAIAQAKTTRAAIILASDPDADRLGVAVRDASSEFVPLTGNRIAALLCDYVLRKRTAAGTLTPKHYVLESVVTTKLVAALAKSHGVRSLDDLMVGFKFVADTMDREGPDLFVFAAEESLGYLTGSYARDKDASVAALLMCETAAELRSAGKTLLDRLDELYVAHGFYLETQKSEAAKGAQGQALIEKLMRSFREQPPAELGGIRFARALDYGKKEIRRLPDNSRMSDLATTGGNLVVFESAPGECEIQVAARPSGTEPKIKFYFFARSHCPNAAALSDIKQQTESKLKTFQQALSDWVQRVWAT
jgi:phosphoglucomutase/phosphomannomutase